MAEEKKKKSIAEILAAARKADSKSGGEVADEPQAPAKAGTGKSEESVAKSESASTSTSGGGKSGGSSPPGDGKRPSTADILAMARAKKKAGEEKAGGESPSKPPAKKTAATSSKKKPAAAAPSSGGPKDTASILAAARKQNRPGPMSKQEAAAQAKASPAGKATAAKVKRAVPPMPAKPAYAKPKPPKAAKAATKSRRGVLSILFGSFLGLGFTSLAATGGLWTLGFARFMFPNVLIEPPSKFKVGFPADFPPGMVATKFKAQYGVWVVNGDYDGESQLYALRSVCTHLGCTPNWLEGEQKFKCPCHGSGFYKDGINFEGPAPRPLERFAIHLADDGQIEIDKSKIFQEEMGQWANPACYIPT